MTGGNYKPPLPYRTSVLYNKATTLADADPKSPRLVFRRLSAFGDKPGHAPRYPAIQRIQTDFKGSVFVSRRLCPLGAWIKKEKGVVNWTWLSRRTFVANALRLHLLALAYNLGNFPVHPKAVLFERHPGGHSVILALGGRGLGLDEEGR